MFREEIPEVKKEGFLVVSRDLYSENQKQPIACKITDKNITFTKSSIVALVNCEKVLIEINVDTKQIIVAPAAQGDKDSVRWIKSPKDVTPRIIECSRFTNQVYDIWKWDKEKSYKGKGKVVSVDKKIMILYDFKDAEAVEKKNRG